MTIIISSVTSSHEEENRTLQFPFPSDKEGQGEERGGESGVW
jgi:hypothetical protein